MARVWVKGYTKPDGTKVKGHYRSQAGEGQYAIVEYDGFKLPGKLNKDMTQLLHYGKKGLYLSLGSDTKILKRFKTKAAMLTK